MTEKLRIGIIGAGKMATALAKGFVQGGLSEQETLIAADPFEPARKQFSDSTGCKTSSENNDALEGVEILILAVKPKHLFDVCEEVASKLNETQIVISIVAGVPIQKIEDILGNGIPVVRVMPNTPCLVGAGACAFSLGRFATPVHAEIVNALLETVGIVEQVEESLLDAVTGLSGSGPAYVFQFVEALCDGAVRMGLPREIATRLATQTVLGSATLLQETGEHPGALKDAVTSPGGTTIAALHALEQNGFRASVMNAVQKATERSIELRKS